MFYLIKHLTTTLLADKQRTFYE